MKKNTHHMLVVLIGCYCCLLAPCRAEENSEIYEYRYEFAPQKNGTINANIIGIEFSYIDITAPMGKRSGSFKFSLNPPASPIFRGSSREGNRPGLLLYEYQETMFIIYGSKIFAVTSDGILKIEGKSYDPQVKNSVTLTPVADRDGMGGKIGSE